jgi:hypothetical protein
MSTSLNNNKISIGTHNGANMIGYQIHFPSLAYMSGFVSNIKKRTRDEFERMFHNLSYGQIFLLEAVRTASKTYTLMENGFEYDSFKMAFTGLIPEEQIGSFRNDLLRYVSNQFRNKFDFEEKTLIAVMKHINSAIQFWDSEINQFNYLEMDLDPIMESTPNSN